MLGLQAASTEDAGHVMNANKQQPEGEIALINTAVAASDACAALRIHTLATGQV